MTDLAAAAETERTESIVCRPKHKGRVWALILGLPVLLLGHLIYELALTNELFLTSSTLTFTALLILVLWLLPGYWLAVNYLTTIVVGPGGLRRFGLPGADLNLDWTEIKRVRLRESQLFVIGPLLQRMILTDASHTRVPEARERVLQRARERDIEVKLDVRGGTA